MKCEELLAMLNEYVDGTVDPAICEEFEKHMAGCNPCQVVVDNIRKTITLYKAGQPYTSCRSNSASACTMCCVRSGKKNFQRRDFVAVLLTAFSSCPAG
jgi:anti-sigma factor RsiW